MRIRAFFVIAVLLLPGVARADMTDVAQQDNWTLHTATGALTKDYFCASSAQFTQGKNSYGLTVARNLLGQSSLVITWPGLGATPGSAVDVRVSLEQKPLRDITATAGSANTLVAPLGWDNDAVDQLAAAPRVSLAVGTTTVQYELKDNADAIHRLGSCTAAALEKLPDSSGLSSEVRGMFKKAGISAVHQVPAHGGENFMVGDLFGGSEILPANKNKPDLTQSMLDEMDALEARCHARFSSDLGAPVPTVEGGELVTAEAQCSTLHSGSFTAMSFVRHGDVTQVYYVETDQNRADQARALRDKIAGALK